MAELRKNPEGIFFSAIGLLEKTTTFSFLFTFFSVAKSRWPELCFTKKEAFKVVVGELVVPQGWIMEDVLHKHAIRSRLYTARLIVRYLIDI